MRAPRRPIDGILLLDKPLGISSNAALQRARSLYAAAKAGHGGSLDPLASGMLPVCFGQATKVCGPLLGSSKVYRVTAALGARTATGDGEGEVVEEAAIPPLAATELNLILGEFLGTQEQVPPMYSALKQGGRRLYDLARQGQTVARTPRTIRLQRLELLALTAQSFELVVECSKGTYIRTLVEDIARRCGTVAHTQELRRLSVAPFEGEPMYSLEGLAAMEPEALAGLLLRPDRALAGLGTVEVGEEDSLRLLQGKLVGPLGPTEMPEKTPARVPGEVLRAYGPGGRFLGLVEGTPEGGLKARRMFT